MAPVPKSSLIYRPDDKGFKKAPAIPKELQLEKGVPVEQLEEEKKRKVEKAKKWKEGRDKKDFEKGAKGVDSRWSPENIKAMERKALLEWEGKDKEREDKIDWSNPGVRKFMISEGRGKEIPEKLKTSTDRNLMAKKVWAKRRKEYKKEDPRSVIGKLGDVLHTGKTSAWGDRTIKEEQEQATLKAKPKPKKLISPEEQEPRAAKDDRGFIESVGDFLYTGSTSKNRAEAQRKRKEYDAAVKAPKVKDKSAPKSPAIAPKVPEAKTKDEPGVKKKKPEGMTDKDWATMGVAGATSLLGSLAASKKAKADRRRAREGEERRAKGAAGRSGVSLGQSIMGFDTRLKGGGKVSFKDVLKAKKKMGY
jgi:hypothetical protein